jgi:hypothetical protein
MLGTRTRGGHSRFTQRLSMTRSREIRAIFAEHVNNPVSRDPRSQSGVGMLGYPDDFTCRSVVGRGLADFSRGFNHSTYGALSPDDLVLLYCYFNMKRHFDTASAVFRRHQAALEPLFSPDGRALFVDIGCGPGTACLALADLLRGRTFEYVGIDSAVPMQNKAVTLWQAAQRAILISASSRPDSRGPGAISTWISCKQIPKSSWPSHTSSRAIA